MRPKFSGCYCEVNSWHTAALSLDERRLLSGIARSFNPPPPRGKMATQNFGKEQKGFVTRCGFANVPESSRVAAQKKAPLRVLL